MNSGLECSLDPRQAQKGPCSSECSATSSHFFCKRLQRMPNKNPRTCMLQWEGPSGQRRERPSPPHLSHTPVISPKRCPVNRHPSVTSTTQNPSMHILDSVAPKHAARRHPGTILSDDNPSLHGAPPLFGRDTTSHSLSHEWRQLWIARSTANPLELDGESGHGHAHQSAHRDLPPAPPFPA